jgi:hypothetical protein
MFCKSFSGTAGAEAADEAVRAVAAAAGPEGGDGGEVALLVPQTPRPGPPAGLRSSAAAGAPLGLSAQHSASRRLFSPPHSIHSVHASRICSKCYV